MNKTGKLGFAGLGLAGILYLGCTAEVQDQKTNSTRSEDYNKIKLKENIRKIFEIIKTCPDEKPNSKGGLVLYRKKVEVGNEEKSLIEITYAEGKDEFLLLSVPNAKKICPLNCGEIAAFQDMDLNGFYSIPQPLERYDWALNVISEGTPYSQRGLLEIEINYASIIRKIAENITCKNE